MNEILELYLAFMKIGAVNFGGGYAMLPLLEEDLAKKKGWVTREELLDYFAIGQCTPGLIALNVSTFIGNKRKGVAGALAATLGFLTCPIIIILIIAMFMKNFADYEIVQHAFAGIRVCVCVLILQAVLLAVFGKHLFFAVPTALLVIASGVFGVFFGKGGGESK